MAEQLLENLDADVFIARMALIHAADPLVAYRASLANGEEHARSGAGAFLRLREMSPISGQFECGDKCLLQTREYWVSERELVGLNTSESDLAAAKGK